MLKRLDELLDDEKELAKAASEAQTTNRSPLRYLYDTVAPTLSKRKQDALDEDISLLNLIFDEDARALEWDILRLLRHYTINFNPAVEAEIVPVVDAAFTEEQTAESELEALEPTSKRPARPK